jgi:hypothetical protein
MEHYHTVQYAVARTISSLIFIRRERLEKDSVELIHRERHDCD